MKYFNNCITIEELKVTYKQLAKQYHPDVGGGTATMQAINTDIPMPAQSWQQVPDFPVNRPTQLLNFRSCTGKP